MTEISTLQQIHKDELTQNGNGGLILWSISGKSESDFENYANVGRWGNREEWEWGTTRDAHITSHKNANK